MTRAPRLIVVDDEPELRKILSDYLGRHGFAVRAVAGAPELDACLTTEEADLLILDIAMPGEDGLSIARRIRSRSAVPILMLTAATDIVDRVVGLEVGADDYVVKPFDLDELTARMRSVLRRAAGRGDPSIQHGELRLDPVARTVERNKIPVNVSAHEFAVLEALLQRPGAVLSRTQLEDRLYGWDEQIGSNAIEVYIHGLRRKLGSDAIRTLRGVGYFVPKA